MSQLQAGGRSSSPETCCPVASAPGPDTHEGLQAQSHTENCIFPSTQPLVPRGQGESS